MRGDTQIGHKGYDVGGTAGSERQPYVALIHIRLTSPLVVSRHPNDEAIVITDAAGGQTELKLHFGHSHVGV